MFKIECEFSNVTFILAFELLCYLITEEYRVYYVVLN